MLAVDMFVQSWFQSRRPQEKLPLMTVLFFSDVWRLSKEQFTDDAVDSR